ncbi:MAG: response regulator [Moorea sp. SIOASIH]|uniref:response regulator n=1 Tax=Moorena sp. SIOASIH TaxID=2607817 RepID=UPI0013BDC320|nr:response regulator [Moorena sp. SIOASIH]NEO35250.1 response regulator [Moorena sp. SIOASIH]
MRILLVEDDEGIAKVVTAALASQHYQVDLATDGDEGIALAEIFKYDLILLDWMLPRLTGIDLCKQLRNARDRTPIILLTAQDTSTNKVEALDAGADDYLVKPLDIPELLARIRAVLRRSSTPLLPVLEWGLLHLDPSNCQVSYDQELLHLTPKEYGLVELFLRNPHRIFSQSFLLDNLWSFEEPPTENAVRAHIKSLRRKLKEAGAKNDLIETVYGLGYRLRQPPEKGSGQTKTEKNKGKKAGKKTPSNLKHSKVKSDSSLSPVPNAQSEEPKQSGLSAIWQQQKSKYIKRVNVLEQAVTDWRDGNLTGKLRQEALREAHTLAGSLGSFGFDQASLKSREIEEILQSGKKASKETIAHLSQLVVELRQELETEDNLPKPTQSQPLPTSYSRFPIPHSPRLLIVDDDLTLAQGLASELAAWKIQVEVAGDISQGRKAIAGNRPDVVLLDLCFPESAGNGFELLEELKTTEPPVPVVVFTAQESFAERVRVARLGGRGFLQKPVAPQKVMAAIAKALQQSGPPQAKLLIVDDDPQILDQLRTVLEPWGFELTLLNDPQQFWETIEQCSPDLLILDVEMPEFSGIDLCQVVRNDPRWGELPVLFLSAVQDAETVQQVFMAGADDYVQKPIRAPELLARVLNRIERSKLRIRTIAQKNQMLSDK